MNIETQPVYATDIVLNGGRIPFMKTISRGSKFLGDGTVKFIPAELYDEQSLYIPTGGKVSFRIDGAHLPFGPCPLTQACPLTDGNEAAWA